MRGPLLKRAEAAKHAQLVTLGVIAAATLGACEKEPILYIKQNNRPGNGCVATSAKGLLAAGSLDVDSRVGLGYTMFPTVVNADPDRGNLSLKRVILNIDPGPSAPPLDHPSELQAVILIAGTIPALSEVVVGPLMVISEALAADFGVVLCDKSSYTRPVINVGLRVVADQAGETHESRMFNYPITLCCKCLVDWRASAPASGDSSVQRNACGAPQDSRVTCYPGTNGRAVCLQDTGT
jgi:hypothetical protein